MLPLIFSAGDGTKGIFAPLHLGIRITSLCCLKNFGVLGAARKVNYLIEPKGEYHSSNTGEVEKSEGKKWHLHPLFCWRALEQNVIEHCSGANYRELLTLRTIYI